MEQEGLCILPGEVLGGGAAIWAQQMTAFCGLPGLPAGTAQRGLPGPWGQAASPGLTPRGTLEPLPYSSKAEKQKEQLSQGPWQVPGPGTSSLGHLTGS